ncbi:pilin [Streptomyces sp. MBT62]|uniref:pilin n=1 Tax=Streptomyces sp. MBT62 TaxID=2800410 RepID=UPI001F350832|nr:pilin [Streptomyces sp. MBT62]
MRLIPLPHRYERAAARVRARLHHTLVVSRVARILSCWLLLTAVALLLVCLLGASSAQAADPGQVLALAQSVNAVLTNIRNWIMGILAGLATVFLTLGGVRYVMAGGDPGEVEKAKTSFKSAGWGYGLAALAPLVVQILKGVVGA